MTEAWKISKGTRNVIVAVVDTGVEVSHRDLANNIWTNERERNGRAGVDDDGNGFVDDVFGWDFANNRPNGLDDNMHGTHCAGIIGAEQNGIGIIGITQNVRIMPLKFLDVSGSGSTDAAVNAINYAVAMGANVISNSWGGGGRSELLDQAIQRAIRAGIIVVAAAGNDSSNNDSVASFPANYSGVIAVASTDQRDNLSSFSNFGVNRVAIAAPGTQILSTVLNGNWNVLSGTSMATPQVAGAIALAMSARPGLPVDLHRQALCNSARKILLNRVACGRLDVNNYLNEVLRF
jgi:subtilisin family serine protease